MIKKDLRNLYAKFLSDLNRLDIFDIICYSSMATAFSFLAYHIEKEETLSKEALEEEFNQHEKTIRDFEHFTSHLRYDEAHHFTFLRQKVFLDRYQIFEEFIASILRILYRNFPRFLGKNETQETLFISKIFDFENIEELQESIIESRIKARLQSNSITKTLSKMEKEFHFSFSIGNMESEVLFLLSRIRNIIVHNSGIVNHTFRKETRNLSFELNLDLGDSISDYLESNAEAFNPVFPVIGKKIMRAIWADTQRLTHYDSAN